MLAGQDWDLIAVDSAQPRITRDLVAAQADAIASPRAGRQYRGWLLDAGCTDVAVEIHTGIFTEPPALAAVTAIAETAIDSGAINRETVENWLEDQRDRASSGRLFIAIPLFVAAGTTPI